MAKLIPFLVSACLGILVAGISAAVNLQGWVVYLTGVVLAVLLVCISAPLALASRNRRSPAAIPKRA